jgi:hypothetical protein
MPKADIDNICGFCGEHFKIDSKDPHWVSGRGPLCPNIKPDYSKPLTDSDFIPTKNDHVINDFARCKKHNTIRNFKNEPCWKCWKEKL